MRTHHSAPDCLTQKNVDSLARWRRAWALQGGSLFERPRDLEDLRSDRDLRRYNRLDWNMSQSRAWLDVHKQLDKVLRSLRSNYFDDRRRRHQVKLRVIK